jgi:hypothetical protein
VAATPGGNTIAAVAIYAGADPLEEPLTTEPTCAFAPQPATRLPIYLIHRACDADVGCNAQQAAAFGVPPGFDVETWIGKLASLGDTTVSDVIINDSAAQVDACATTCAQADGLTEDLEWPDGIADMSGVDWEPMMLDFLAAVN